jgi:3-dehydroquinate synthase
MKGFLVEEKNLIIGAHLCFLIVILLPFIFFADQLETWAAELVAGERDHEIAILTVSLLTLDVVLPVPSSFVNTSAMLYLGPITGFIMVFSGLSLGCILGYAFGFYFRKILFDRFYSDRAFRGLTFDLARYGFFTLVMARGIPVIAELSVMAAGYHRYPVFNFLFATLLSNFLLAAIYAGFVAFAVEVQSFGFFIFTLVAVPTLATTVRWVWLKWRSREQRIQAL